MTKIDSVLKKLSELYEFHRRLKAYQIKEKTLKPRGEDAARGPRAR
ncbi:MAG: hypothetical protein MUF52_01900 [Syntrophobacteraceae bacterium]|jgi:hypothetical protein|nr:hypothetical protein [Syntrophobacteraceae bacterium]